MMRWSFGALALLGPCALVTLSLGAQDSLSASAAHDLSELLTARKLDAVATRDPAESDRFIAALFFPKSQLLVITARYTVPSLLEEKLAKRQYRDIYGDLHGASLQESKVSFRTLGPTAYTPKEITLSMCCTREESHRRSSMDESMDRVGNRTPRSSAKQTPTTVACSLCSSKN